MHGVGAERPHTQLWPFCLPPAAVASLPCPRRCGDVRPAGRPCCFGNEEGNNSPAATALCGGDWCVSASTERGGRLWGL